MTQQINIYDEINAIQTDFEQIADKNKQVVWKEECQFAFQAVGKNQNLQQCFPISVQNAVKNVAATGLTLNPALGLAYLVPEYNKALRGNECQLRISFQGLIKLATDSGAIKVVKAEIVREHDEFIYNGPMQEPVHKVNNPFDESARGAPIGVYCQAVTHEDRFLVDLMSWDEVQKIRSKAKFDSVWSSWESEMAKKAILKRAYKQWPKTEKSDQLAAAIAVSNEHEGSADNEHTAEQLEKYLKYLNDGTPIEFAGFIDSLDEQIVMSLFNSGAKGEKVHQKKRHSEKEMSGKRDIAARAAMLNSGDDEQIEDAMDGLNEREQMIIKRAA